MKLSLYDIVKAKYLVDENSAKNWLFIIFLIIMSLLMIGNIHVYEDKGFQVEQLNHEIKELRTEFVQTRSELMVMKMESSISTKMEDNEIFPSEVPPQKIKVVKEVKGGFWTKLWQ